MQDDLKERLRRIVKKPYSAKRGPPPCELQMLDRIAALEAKLAEKDALLRECEEALAGPNAWLERWASHVGGCHGGSLCQCGLTLAKLESATTLAKIKDATDA